MCWGGPHAALPPPHMCGGAGRYMYRPAGGHMCPPEQHPSQTFFKPPRIMCTPGRSAGEGAW